MSTRHHSAHTRTHIRISMVFSLRVYVHVCACGFVPSALFSINKLLAVELKTRTRTAETLIILKTRNEILMRPNFDERCKLREQVKTIGVFYL